MAGGGAGAGLFRRHGRAGLLRAGSVRGNHGDAGRRGAGSGGTSSGGASHGAAGSGRASPRSTSSGGTSSRGASSRGAGVFGLPASGDAGIFPVGDGKVRAARALADAAGLSAVPDGVLSGGRPCPQRGPGHSAGGQAQGLAVWQGGLGGLHRGRVLSAADSHGGRVRPGYRRPGAGEWECGRPAHRKRGRISGNGGLGR